MPEKRKNILHKHLVNNPTEGIPFLKDVETSWENGITSYQSKQN